MKDWGPQDKPEIFLGAILFIYALFTVSLGNGPLQDLPNHLTRAHIIGDLLFNQGAVYGKYFSVDPTFTPYFAGDFILSLLDKWFGTEGASRLWITASVLVLPWSVWFALRSLRASPMGAVTGAILSIYVSTDWFFTMGFLN